MLCGHGRSADRYRPSHLEPESDRPILPAMRLLARSPLVWLAHWQEEPAPNALLPGLRAVGLRRIRSEFPGAPAASKRQQFRARAPRQALRADPRPVTSFNAARNG